MSKNKDTQVNNTHPNRQGKSRAGFIDQDIILIIAGIILGFYVAVNCRAAFNKFVSNKTSSSSSPNQSQQSCGAAVLSSAATTLQGCEFYRMNANSNWMEDIINRIWVLESGGQLNPTAGDGGKAIGPMQIHQCVLDDVNKYYGTNYDAEACKDIRMAREIAAKYILILV